MNTQKKIFIYIILFTFFLSLFTSIGVNKYFGKTVYIEKNNVTNNKNISDAEIKKSIESVKDLQTSVKGIAQKISTSVVSIIISKDVQTFKSDPFGFFRQPSGVINQKVGGGTGFFVNKNGVILTNKHVVNDTNADYTIITSNNEEYKARILALDPTTDLAFIVAIGEDGEAIKNNSFVTFNNDSSNIEVGNFVIAVGNALAEFQNTVTFGLISGLGRSIEAGSQSSIETEVLSGLIQTDAAINPGNSGGPLVNLNGEVVGVNTAIAAGANGLGFSIPLTQKEVDYLIKSIEKYSEIKRAFLGIRYTPLNENIAKSLGLLQEKGDLIGAGDTEEAIVKGSPAEEAGLKEGDIIIEVNGTTLGNGVSVKDVLKEKMPEDKIILKIIRDSEEKIIEVTLGAR